MKKFREWVKEKEKILSELGNAVPPISGGQQAAMSDIGLPVDLMQQLQKSGADSIGVINRANQLVQNGTVRDLRQGVEMAMKDHMRLYSARPNTQGQLMSPANQTAVDPNSQPANQLGNNSGAQGTRINQSY